MNRSKSSRLKNILLALIALPVAIGQCLRAVWTISPFDASHWLVWASTLLTSFTFICIGIPLLLFPRALVNWLLDTSLAKYLEKVEITLRIVIYMHILGAVLTLSSAIWILSLLVKFL